MKESDPFGADIKEAPSINMPDGVVDQKRSVIKSTSEAVRIRNFFYRDGYRRLLTVVVIQSIALALSIVAIALLHKPMPPRYFATSLNGSLFKMTPLDKPSLAIETVLGWSARAVASALTFNFLEYQKQIENTKNTYFTIKGGQLYLDALRDSRHLSDLVNKKLLEVAQVIAAPELVWSGIITNGQYQGRYGWRLKIPVSVQVEGCDTQRFKRQLEVILLVVRSMTLQDHGIGLDSMFGIGIAQFLVRNWGGAT
jgi:Type-IV b secretion system, inner-membrane complex component